ncbi:MAG: NAD-dependent epimerase/dehydratase family protein [Candidatus Omnitrophica bacterium]|nr:NAD-dependent epimerase/dehydratase family protein [Candidatus Omnitrophota bacterium]
MARALVLGATGHIGAHIVRALLAEGHHVRAAYRRESFLHVLGDLPVERLCVDLATCRGLSDALRDCDWVFHAAGYYPGLRERREPAITQGVESTARILEACARARPSRIVFTSSASTIQRLADRPATEADAEPWPLTAWRPLYATVKIAMEQEALRAARGGLPVVITNPSVCVGEYDAHPFSGRLILAFAKYQVPFYLDRDISAIYTGDVGVGHVRAAQRGRLGERYLLTHRDLSLRAFATSVARAAGTRPPRWRLPHRVVLAAAWLSERVAGITRTEPFLPMEVVRAARIGQRLDGTKAVTELGLPQTPIEEAIERAVRWFKDHGYL